VRYPGPNRRLAGAIAIALLATTRTWAGTISGSVTLDPADLLIRDSSKPNPYVGQLSAGGHGASSAAAADTAYGVAWVADLPPGKESASAPVRMDQAGQQFVPRILVIVAGQSVEFHNSDNVYHNIFSYSPPKRFDLGRYSKGHSRTVSFAKPGVVQIYCDIHSDMRADLIVAPSERYALIGRSGRFRISDVPAGSRTVKVWLPSSGVRSANVDVPAVGLAPLEMTGR
jgi:plastocyanin